MKEGRWINKCYGEVERGKKGKIDKAENMKEKKRGKGNRSIERRKMDE